MCRRPRYRQAAAAGAYASGDPPGWHRELEAFGTPTIAVGVATERDQALPITAVKWAQASVPAVRSDRIAEVGWYVTVSTAAGWLRKQVTGNPGGAGVF